MNGRSAVVACGGFLAWLGVCQVYSQVGGEPAPTAKIRVAVPESMFRGRSDETVRAVLAPFQEILEKQTGRAGETTTVKDHTEAARRLVRREADLGVFHGFEFAWARRDHPDLRVLVVAVSDEPYLRAWVVVRGDAAPRTFEDLKGRPAALPANSKEHVRFFLERRVLAVQGQPATYFANLLQPESAEEALDDVVDGKVEAAIVDEVALKRFRERKPGRAARLRDLEASPTFPPTVTAYLPETLDEGALARIRDALLETPRTPQGKQMLTTWRITGFATPPDDFEKVLSDIAKAYPPPPATAPSPPGTSGGRGPQ